MRNLIAQFVRFLGIGFLNTAIDFAVLNTLMFYSGIFTGAVVGMFSTISFLLAVSHSYFWNRYLVFKKSGAEESVIANLGEFIYAGVLGAGVIFLVGLGSSLKYSFAFYLGLLLALVIGELFFWYWFKIGQNIPAEKSRQEYFAFVFITAIGLVINVTLLVIITKFVPPQFGFNQELWTNVVKALVTGVSLVWNFGAYKVLLFKK